MLEKAIEKTGVKFLGWSENGFRELTTSKGPIEKPEDMKGMKLRVCGTPIFIDIFSSLGANPQAINWSEAVTGFQQGIVDGQENPTNGINVPTKVWKEFSPEDQKLILSCAAEAEKYGKALSRLSNDNGQAYEYLKSINKLPAVTNPKEELKKNGMTVTEYTPEMIKRFYEATAGVRADWTQKIGPDVVKAAEEDMKAAK